MKVITSSVRIEATRAEWQRVSDAMLLKDRGQATYIVTECTDYDDEGYRKSENAFIPDGRVVGINFGTRQSVESVLAAIRALGLDVDDASAPEAKTPEEPEPKTLQEVKSMSWDQIQQWQADGLPMAEGFVTDFFNDSGDS